MGQVTAPVALGSGDSGPFVGSDNGSDDGSSGEEETKKNDGNKAPASRSFFDMLSTFGIGSGSGAPPTQFLDDDESSTHGGAPPTHVSDSDLKAEDTIDADAETVVAVFRTATLGVDLVGGPSVGHVPILGTEKEVTAIGPDGREKLVLLEEGSQLIQVANTSLIDAEDPFILAVQTIQDSPRPIHLRFQHPARPAPYSVVFTEQRSHPPARLFIC
jgi:hypothetical protein